jgi:hypothetical protein
MDFDSHSHSSGGSPRLMTADLGLDPSDPLNLLLHNSAQHSSSSSDISMDDSNSTSDSASNGSAPNWAQVNDMWAVSSPAMEKMLPPSSFAIPDMDFNPAITIDPSLHFDAFGSSLGLGLGAFGAGINFDAMNPGAYGIPTEFIQQDNNPFGFSAQGFPLVKDFAPTPTFAPAPVGVPVGGALPQMAFNPGHVRRLSGTSSSESSSGASSMSPVLEHPRPSQMQSMQFASLTVDPTPNTGTGDAAEDLAQKVRQSAGVMLAVPMSQAQGGQMSVGVGSGAPLSKSFSLFLFL